MKKDKSIGLVLFLFTLQGFVEILVAAGLTVVAAYISVHLLSYELGLDLFLYLPDRFFITVIILYCLWSTAKGLYGLYKVYSKSWFGEPEETIADWLSPEKEKK